MTDGPGPPPARGSSAERGLDKHLELLRERPPEPGREDSDQQQQQCATEPREEPAELLARTVEDAGEGR